MRPLFTRGLPTWQSTYHPVQFESPVRLRADAVAPGSGDSFQAASISTRASMSSAAYPTYSTIGSFAEYEDEDAPVDGTRGAANHTHTLTHLPRTGILRNFSAGINEDHSSRKKYLQLTPAPGLHGDPHQSHFDWCVWCPSGCWMCREKDMAHESTEDSGGAELSEGDRFDRLGTSSDFFADNCGVDGGLSYGSAAHAFGICSPCAHNWRPEGCSRGRLCERCHTCTEADFRRYRQGAVAARRARRSAHP
eukprot:TRINITY_DN17132_c0_g1_i1.p1 TRINITY_DN17132_c0_g1~~TRINITY_DN17132_c0_g1_i1.p1  ORF type:complete len:250 (-),score=7.72 TRINITY_DN17132_c0_g1_i1:356-1105(-)